MSTVSHDVRRVAAGEHDDDRRAGLQQPVEDQLVARAQAVLGEREAAEPVALPRVRARQEERDVGSGRRPIAVSSGVLERAQVLVVARAGGEIDVEVGRDPLERVVAGAVQRQRERVRIGAEELRGAVALVDVAVDDQGTPRDVLASAGAPA